MKSADLRRFRSSIVFYIYSAICAVCAVFAFRIFPTEVVKPTFFHQSTTILAPAGLLAFISRISSLVVCSALVYENAVIASGSFLGAGDLLESLSYGRYYLHLLAPVATFSGLDIAVSAGAHWVLSYSGLVIFIGVTCFMIGWATWHMISVGYQLLPKSEQGLLIYSCLHSKTSKEDLIALVLPVVWLSVAMVVLGLGAAYSRFDDATIWPVAAGGPLLCFILCSQGRHAKWMENLGEVILMSSVVYLQANLSF